MSEETVPVPDAAKRLSLELSDNSVDWFHGDSPRNAPYGLPEGQWYHWMHLAAQILSHPFSEIVDPDHYRPDLKEFADIHVYNEEGPNPLTPEDLARWPDD